MSEGETDQAPGTQADWPLRPWMLAALLALAGLAVLALVRWLGARRRRGDGAHSTASMGAGLPTEAP